MERGRAEGASWELPHQENQSEAPAYLDPAALSFAETSPNPRGLNEQHPCYWPGFRDPTRWGLPCESAPRGVASKWWLNTGSPHLPLPTRCVPCPHSARPGDGPCSGWLESICSLSECVTVRACMSVSGYESDRCHLQASQVFSTQQFAGPQRGASKRSDHSQRSSVRKDWGVLGVPASCYTQTMGKGQAICLR